MTYNLDNAHGHAAINHKALPGDEVIFDEGDNQSCNLFGLAFAMQWDAITDVVIDLRGGKMRLKRSANYARRNTIYANVLVGKLASQAARELRQSALDNAIGQSAGTAAEARRRAEQDDGSRSLLCHARRCSTGKMKDGVNMNSESIHPGIVGNFVKSSWNGASCRMHKNIEAAEFVDDLLYAITTRCRIGNVAFQESNSRTESFEIRSEFLLRLNACSGNGCDVSAFAGQAKRGGGANAAAATSDETDFAL